MHRIWRAKVREAWDLEEQKKEMHRIWRSILGTEEFISLVAINGFFLLEVNKIKEKTR